MPMYIYIYIYIYINVLNGADMMHRDWLSLQSFMNAKVKRIKPDFAFAGSAFKL